MKNIVFFFIFFYSACSVNSYGQVRSIVFDHVGTKDGLSQGSINCMYKDSYGLMWIGTQDGLNKYDGYKFTVYRRKLNDPKSIVANDIYSIVEDRDGNIWIAAVTGGVSMYDRKNDSFVSYTENKNKPNSLSNKEAYVLYADRKGNIWVGTMNGLNLFDRKTKGFIVYNYDEKNSSGLSSNAIMSISEDSKGNFWIGTDYGLNLFDRATGKCKVYANDPKNVKSLANNVVNKIVEDSFGNLWIGTNTNLELFDPQKEIFTHFPSSYSGKTIKKTSDVIYAIAQEGDYLWIGARSLSLFDIKTKTYIDYNAFSASGKNVKEQIVYSIMLDKQNILWIGSGTTGLFKHEKNVPRLRSYSLSHKNQGYNTVRSFSEDQKGNIWIGTDGGLSYFNRADNSFTYINDSHKKIKATTNLSVIQSRDDNSIWIGSGQGVEHYDPATGAYKFYTSGNGRNDLTYSYIRSMFEDKRGKIWIGTGGGGINVWDKQKETFIKYKKDTGNGNGLSNNDIGVLCEDNQGKMWIGTLTSGVDVYDPSKNKFTNYNSSNSNINGDVINTIFNDSKGNIWIGTMDGGLNMFNNETNDFTSYTEEDGLINDAVNSIQEDKKGYLWISTNKGIVRFDPVAKKFRNYSLKNGLQAEEFNSGSGMTTRSGEILFGGPEGFNLFDPSTLPENNNIPVIAFTGFELFNKPMHVGKNGSVLEQSIFETKTIRLSHSQSVFTIEFAALSFVSQEKNQYAYKLEGFDNDWNYVGSQRKATYTNLSPGEYVFRVKASNNDGVWNETGSSIKIIITPPFWMTWWFKLAGILVIAGSIMTVYRFRMNIIKAQKKELQKQVREQTTQLVHANEQERKARMEAEKARTEVDKAYKELERKNSELEQFAYIASHDLQEPLRTTSSFIELLHQQYKGSLDEKADRYLMFISQASERMKTLIRDLLDYSRIGNKKEMQQVNCNDILQEVLADISMAVKEADAEVTSEPLPVICGYSTEIKQLFQNLIINAIKFRKKDTSPEIRIRVNKSPDHWTFTVADNGIGIEKKNSDKIFVIFQRLHNRNEYPGSGIGLSYCKKIVELHKGRIWVDSTPGIGSTFYFTILQNNN